MNAIEAVKFAGTAGVMFVLFGVFVVWAMLF